LIALCPEEEEAKSAKGLRYGKVTDSLAELITSASRPKKEAPKNA
jgi:hypothetical protein